MSEIKKTLAFTPEEYKGRLARVQATMAAQGLDGLIVHTPENICYLSGFHTSGYYFLQIMLVPAKGDPLLILRSHERMNVQAFSWLALDRAIGYVDTDHPVDVVVRALDQLRLTKGRLGVDRIGFFFPIGRYEELKARLPNATFGDGSLIVEKERAIKSPKEIEYIREAARISGKGLQAIVENARHGMTENALAGHIHKALVENGGEYTGLPVFLSTGWRTMIPHATWSDKVIEQGDNIYCELTGVTRRYARPHERNFKIGKPDQAYADYAKVCVEMVDTVIAAIRPGVESNDVDMAVRKVLTKHGFPTDKKVRTGYSVGLNFPPDWGEGYFLDLKIGDRTVLKPGMVFHCPQSPRVPGRPGCAISETIMVTETGSEVLTNFRRELIVL